MRGVKPAIGSTILHECLAYQKFVQDRREAEKQKKIKQIREEQRKKKMYIDIAIITGGVVMTLAVILTFIWAISAAR